MLFQRLAQFLLLCAYILNLVSGLLLPSLYLRFLIQRIFNLLVILVIRIEENITSEHTLLQNECVYNTLYTLTADM